jgi:hypothetical protein
MNRDHSIEKTPGSPLRLYPPVWFLLFAGAAAVLAWLWPLPLSLPAPIGLYFASLWYYEKLYPRIYAAAALEKIASVS